MQSNGNRHGGGQAGKQDIILVPPPAEKQQEHRMQLERIAIEGQVMSNVRGQSFGFATFIVGLLVSIAFAYFGMYTYAGILATGTLVTIVGLFLNGGKQIKKDLKEKSKDQ